MVMDVRDKWDLFQSNGFTLHMEVAEEDNEGAFTGQANVDGKAGFQPIADARATDSDFTFLLGNGRYVGNFNNGRLSGITFDNAHPNSQATWHASKDFGPKTN
nr:hypothetical protein OH820_31105 [Streptomyces sp. NBC_00857]